MRKPVTAIIVVLLLSSFVSAGDFKKWDEFKKWSFPGRMDEVFNAAARVIQHNWTTRMADRKVQSIDFETVPSRDIAGSQQFVCSSHLDYVASLRELRPGVVQISLATKKGAFFTPKVEACIAERFFMGIQSELNPSIEPPVQLSAEGMAAFRLYLQGLDDKAFAVSGAGDYGLSIDQRFKSEAIKGALEACERTSVAGGCKPVMLNTLKVID